VLTTSGEGFLHLMKAIRATQLVSPPSPVGALRTWAVVRNDTLRYSPCLYGIPREALAKVCKVMRVVHQMKLALLEQDMLIPWIRLDWAQPDVNNGTGVATNVHTAWRRWRVGPGAVPIEATSWAEGAG
jgi:hypothetical protein